MEAGWGNPWMLAGLLIMAKKAKVVDI